MQKSFKRIRAGLDGHRSAPSDDTGQPPPHICQVVDVTGDVQSGSDMDVYHLVMPCTVGDEQSSMCVVQMEKLDEIFEGETSKMIDSPVDEKSAGSDRKAFIQQCTVNEINALVDEQSAGAETKVRNPVDEQSAGTMHGSGNPVDGQSAGLTEKQQSPDAGTLLKGKVEGLAKDILKKILTKTIDAILDQGDIDLRHNTLLEHKIDIGCAMPIRQGYEENVIGNSS